MKAVRKVFTIEQWIRLHEKVWGRYPTLRETIWQFESTHSPAAIAKEWERVKGKQEI